MDFFPSNELEKWLLDAQEGRSTSSDFFSVLLSSRIFIPSQKEVSADGNGLQPLFFDRSGKAMVVVFTSTIRITEAFTKDAKYCLEIPARNFLLGLPDGLGIVINPSHQVGLEIPPDGLKRMKADLQQNKKKPN